MNKTLPRSRSNMFQNQSKRNISFVKELILFHHLANIPLESVAVSGEIEDPSLVWCWAGAVQL